MKPLDEDCLLGSAVENVLEVFGAGQTPELYAGLIVEEAKEVREALQHLLKELTDLQWVSEAYTQLGGEPGNIMPLVEGHVDLDLLEGIFQAFSPGQEDEAVRRVYASNMSKVGPDGKPVYREDGKYTKGPNYQPADLSDLVGPTNTTH